MKKLTKEQWEGVKERFYKEFGHFTMPATYTYNIGKTQDEFEDKDILSFFEKEVVEDTETPGEEKCLYCEFGHNGKNNPNAGTHFKQEGGRCTQCGSTFPQEKGSKPESSWERKEWVEELHEILNDRTSGVIDDVHIYSLIRKVEKEAYNLALEEAEKEIEKYVKAENSWDEKSNDKLNKGALQSRNKMAVFIKESFEALRALKKV